MVRERILTNSILFHIHLHSRRMTYVLSAVASVVLKKKKKKKKKKAAPLGHMRTENARDMSK